ncbi:major facilitator superfamily domain-containing protein [Trichoderma pleuroticola]
MKQGPIARSSSIEQPNAEQGVPLSSLRAIFIAAVLIFTQLVQIAPFGAGVAAAASIGHTLNASESQSAWIAASYPLTQGAFVLAGGRVGAVYGHKHTFSVASLWWVIWTLISGFAPNIIALSCFRGLAGVGGAFMVPNAIALIGITFPPGEIRNMTIGLFGAMAPVGSSLGNFLGALFVQLTKWEYLFFCLAIVGTVVFTAAWIFLPAEDQPLDPKGSIDYIGAYLGIGGLVLFNFVWNQAPAVGWATPYEYALLMVAVLHFAGFALWEKQYAKQPIMPLDIWAAPSFFSLLVVTLFCFMSTGISIWYFSIWMQTARHWSPLLTSAGFVPLGIMGAVGSVAAAWLIPRLAAQYILAIGATCMTVSCILFATMPAEQLYWAQAFPAMICLAFCPDFVFTAAQIITSNSVRREHQGIAGSLIGTLMTYGMSTGLGFAGTVEMKVNNHGVDIVKGYRGAFYLAIGLAVTSLVLDLAFVRMPKDTRGA